jgi:hypothetical protein
MGRLDYCIAQLRVSAFVLLPAVPVRNYDIPPASVYLLRRSRRNETKSTTDHHTKRAARTRGAAASEA